MRYAVVCSERRRFNAGIYGAVVPRPAPHPRALAARPAGKRPCAFPRTPFSASARKICLMGAILNNDVLRSAAAMSVCEPETDRDRFCVFTDGCLQTNTAANGRLQTDFPATAVSDKSDKSDLSDKPRSHSPQTPSNTACLLLPQPPQAASGRVAHNVRQNGLQTKIYV